MCKAIQVLLTHYYPMLLYLGHLVRQCNWAGETANTGVFASEGLQIVMCLLDRLNMGDTLLKYQRTVAIALLCHTAWHTAMPGQAFAEEFCESLLSSLVTKKGQNRDAVTIEDVDNVMASNSSSAAARKSQVAVAIALQSVNNKEGSNANCE